MESTRTEDGVEIRQGDRVFNYYDGKWGTVGEIDSEGWFTHSADDGTRSTLNGERVAMVLRPGWPMYDAWKAGR